MADKTTTVQNIILQDNWPGTPIDPPVDYTEMTSAAVGHNVATNMWPLGTKWEVYCSGDPTSLGVGYHVGWARFIYLKAADDIETAVLGAVTVLAVPDGTLAAGMAHDRLYTVVCDSAETTHETMGLVAMCISTLTNSYYGWYWCGGVCPIEYISGMTKASTIATDSTVAASCQLSTVATAATGIGLRAQPAASQVPSCGFAFYDDAA